MIPQVNTGQVYGAETVQSPSALNTPCMDEWMLKSNMNPGRLSVSVSMLSANSDRRHELPTNAQNSR